MTLTMSPSLRQGRGNCPTKERSQESGVIGLINAFRQNPTVISVGRAGRVQLDSQSSQLADFVIFDWTRNYMKFYITHPVTQYICGPFYNSTQIRKHHLTTNHILGGKCHHSPKVNLVIT